MERSGKVSHALDTYAVYERYREMYREHNKDFRPVQLEAFDYDFSIQSIEFIDPINDE